MQGGELVGAFVKAYSVRMKPRWFLLIALLALVGTAGWWFRGPVGAWLGSISGSVELGVRKTVKPDPKTYAVLVSELARWRKDLTKRHRQAKTDVERKAVEHDARVILERTLPEMMRCWLGTPWDFNGTAAMPGGGRIACGYFVSTVLMDAGFQVDRYQLAQQPSGNILRSFLEKDDCVLTVGKPYDAFAAELADAEPGIYLIGLDTHVGFLKVDGKNFRMIHASGSRPWCVVDESREDALVLQKSNWRMLGNLTADAEVLRCWLKSEKVVVKGA
jgi:hypothetical protein